MSTKRKAARPVAPIRGLSKEDKAKLSRLSEAAFLRVLKGQGTDADVSATRALLILCGQCIERIPHPAAGVAARVLGMAAWGSAIPSLKPETKRGRREALPKKLKRDNNRAERIAVTMHLFTVADVGTTDAIREVKTLGHSEGTIYAAMRRFKGAGKQWAKCDVPFLVHLAQPEIEKLLRSTSETGMKFRAFIDPFMQ